MIKVSNLTKSYGSQILFQDISFNLNVRERIGLVGRNGHGKTTLLRLMLKQEEPDSGSISIPKNYTIGYLEQHLNFAKSSILEEACTGLPVGYEHDSWRAEKILFGLGFTKDDLDRPPAEFSGGFQVRLNLAKVLVSNPDLLLLDEPTNYLDILSIRWLRKFLRSWKGELVLITHDRSFMDSVVTHTLGIHRRKIRKVQGDTGKLYNQIAQDEEVYEKTRRNEEKRRKDVEQFIRRFRAKARLANMVQSRIKTLQKQEKKERLEKIETLEFSFNAAPFPAKVMMEVEDLSFTYENSLPNLFADLNLTVGPYDRICIVGKNGKGKTTLLKVMAGELQPGSGKIRRHPILQPAFFEQTNTAKLDPEKTVEEEILTAAESSTRQKARDVAGSMMFSGDNALKKISVLSGGEKSRVLLGKLLVTPSHLLLLDEPTNHLDMESCDSLLAAIDAFDGAVILITHNEMFLSALATRLIVFDRGKAFVYEGTYQNFLKDIGWEIDEVEGGKNSEVASVTIDKKALRKQKAEIVQQKSKTLKPLESKIAEHETKIEDLERELSEMNHQLIAASTTGDGEKIATLGKSQQQLQSRLDSFYDELDSVTQEFEKYSLEFEEKMQAFS